MSKKLVCLVVVASIFQGSEISGLGLSEAGATSLSKAADPDLSKEEKTKVYAVFFSLPAEVHSKALSVLKSKCKGMEFVGETISYDGTDYSMQTDPEKIFIDTKENNLVLQSIENSKNDLDGLILFFGGISDRRYMLTGLPTIIVDVNPCTREIGFKNAVTLAERYGTKYITPTQGIILSEFDSKLSDLPEKVKLFNVIRKMKSAKLLTIQDYDKINPLDQWRWVGLAAPVNDYDRNYPVRLKEYFGTEIRIARSDELNWEIGKVKQKEAEKIADMWINEAKEVRRGVTRKDVIRAAKLYLAIEKLIKKYDADAVTMASWNFAGMGAGGPKINVMPPLTWMELSKKHIPCSCESLINCLVTQMVGTYMTEGWAGFLGDVLNDWTYKPTGARPENVVIIGHCGAPITPHGDDRIPYTIRDHIMSGAGWAKLFDPEGTVTATTVDWPSGEVASLIKFDVYSKRVSVFTGTVLDGNSLYKDFPDTMCRNKMVIQINKPESCYLLPSDPKEGLMRTGLPDNPHHWNKEWGSHPVVFYGDHRQKIRDLAALIGFEVIEGKTFTNCYEGMYE